MWSISEDVDVGVNVLVEILPVCTTYCSVIRDPRNNTLHYSYFNAK